MRIAVDPDHNVLHIELEGLVKFTALRPEILAFFGREDLKPITRVLVDLSGMEDFDLTFSNVFSLVSHVSRELQAEQKTLDVAIFAPEDHAFGGARMLQQTWEVVTGDSVKIVRTGREMCQWRTESWQAGHDSPNFSRRLS